MPHTTTKNSRNKRPDTRPNGKLRRALKAKAEDGKVIQDLRVTKVQKNEKKERIAQVTPLSTLSKNEKLLRAMKKKMNAIQELHVLRDSGVELNGEQLDKLGCENKLISDMEQLVGRSLSQQISE
jgi:hypothetical protein